MKLDAPCPECRRTLTDLWDYDWQDKDVLLTWCQHCALPVDVVRHTFFSYVVVRGTGGTPSPERTTILRLTCEGCGLPRDPTERTPTSPCRRCELDGRVEEAEARSRVLLSGVSQVRDRYVLFAAEEAERSRRAKEGSLERYNGDLAARFATLVSRALGDLLTLVGELEDKEHEL